MWYCKLCESRVSPAPGQETVGPLSFLEEGQLRLLLVSDNLGRPTEVMHLRGKRESLVAAAGRMAARTGGCVTLATIVGEFHASSCALGEGVVWSAVSSGGVVSSGGGVQDFLAVISAEEDGDQAGGGILTKLGRQKLEQALQQFATGPLGLRNALSEALGALDHDAPLSSEHRRLLEEHCGGWFTLAGEVKDLLAALSDAERRRVAFCFRGRGLIESLGGSVLPAEAVSLGEVREFLDGPSVTRPVAAMARSIDLAVRVVTRDRSELPLNARDEVVELATLVDRGALRVPGRPDHRVAWARGLRALISAADQRGTHFTSPMIDAATRGILITIEEWCWKRYRLTRPWPDPPGGPDLGGAFLDARRLLDGTGAYSYPHVSRDQLLSLLSEETSPLIAEERSAVRKLIDAADLAAAGAAAARGISLTE